MLLHPFLVDDASTVGQLGRLRPGPDVVQHPLDDARCAERDAFVIELIRDQLPTLVLTTHECRGRHAHVVVEGVVGVVLAHEVHGDDADARRVHGDEKQRDALVLGDVGIRPRRQPYVVGTAGQARVNLGAVDDIFLPVAHGTGLQRGQVGTRVRFGVADTKVDVSRQNLRQEELLLLLRSEIHDRRSDRVDGQHRHRRSAAHRFVEEDELLDGRAALAPPLLGPSDAQPTVRSHLLDHPAHRRPDAGGLGKLFLELGGEQVLVVGP